ncbi:aldolase [Dentipellis sp. KUC8613]|nr:aldolase [Dentipellis sp. KUC8613]
MSAPTLLTAIRSRVVVDVDSMDPDVAARHTDKASGQQFCDMTSNQAIVYGEATKPERSALLKAAVKASNVNADVLVNAEQQVVDNALDLITVQLAKTVYPYLTGRVHAQTSPSAAFDTEKTIAHAKRLVSVFEANGIPKSRVCIKIPATPESLIACQYLEKTGIRTLGTCLFSVAQAEAAAEAGCLYIAPYFNELRVHFEPSVWKEYKDTASEHPMAQVIRDIVRVYKANGTKTLVMPASIVTAAEVEALVSLHPNHLTLSGGVLDKLAALPAPAASGPNDPEPPHASADGPPPSAEPTSYLANDGAKLREALAADAESTRKLLDALKIFGEMEDKLREVVKKELLAL